MTKFNYNETDLNCEVEIIFPKLLGRNEQLLAENIVNYWSNIPYVTTEGIYDIRWKDKISKSVLLIGIDFTKSASDDIGDRNVLELLSEYLENGTPVRVRAPHTGTRKWEGLNLEPILIRTDFL